MILWTDTLEWRLSMLVYFYKGLTLEGEASFFEKKHFWSKPVEDRRNIHLFTWIEGICDESEVEQEIARRTKESLEKNTGWGTNFSGWLRVLTRDEALRIAKEEKWTNLDRIPKDEPRVEYLATWKMDKILKTLTGEQFVQFCKENNLGLGAIKE